MYKLKRKDFNKHTKEFSKTCIGSKLLLQVIVFGGVFVITFIDILIEGAKRGFELHNADVYLVILCLFSGLALVVYDVFYQSELIKYIKEQTANKKK